MKRRGADGFGSAEPAERPKGDSAISDAFAGRYASADTAWSSDGSLSVLVGTVSDAEPSVALIALPKGDVGW